MMSQNNQFNSFPTTGFVPNTFMAGTTAPTPGVFQGLPLAGPTTSYMPAPEQQPLYEVLQVIPHGMNFLVYQQDGSFTCDSSMCTIQNGLLYPPQGYSFVSTWDLPSLKLKLDETRLSVASSTTESRSRSPSPCALPLQEVEENIPTKVQETPKVDVPQKRPHRSKQNRINEVHSKIQEIYLEKGLLAGDDEILRGPDTLRVHCKTWPGLDSVQRVLAEVEEAVDIDRIATPFSMKNKFQKKGFIVYMKLRNVHDVPRVQAIFAKYVDCFKKCDIALPSQKSREMEEKKRLEQQKRLAETDFFLPPAFTKNLSAGAA